VNVADPRIAGRKRGKGSGGELRAVSDNGTAGPREEQAARTEYPEGAAAHVAHLLRPHYRVGLAGRTGTSTGVPERRAARDLPLPKALDDVSAVRFLKAAAAGEDLRRQLVVELLARTGVRIGELCDSAVDAVDRVTSPSFR